MDQALKEEALDKAMKAKIAVESEKHNGKHANRVKNMEKDLDEATAAEGEVAESFEDLHNEHQLPAIHI